MANTKISALGSGTTPQVTDEIVIARAGANFKLTYAQLIAGLFTNVASITVDDANFGLDIVSSNPRVTFDSGDYMEWVRASDVLAITGDVAIGASAADVATGAARTLTVSTGGATGYATLELIGTQAADTAVGAVRYLNGTTMIGQLAFIRSGADDSGEFRVLVANAGAPTQRFLITKDGTIQLCGDALFNLAISGGNPLLTMDTGDYLSYDRAGNSFVFTITGAPVFQVGSGFAILYNNGVPNYWLVDTSKGANLKNGRLELSTQEFVFYKVNDDFTTSTELGRITSGGQIKAASATPFGSTVSATNGAAAATATMTNAPVAGNPTKWVPYNDNGTTRYQPMW